MYFNIHLPQSWQFAHRNLSLEQQMDKLGEFFPRELLQVQPRSKSPVISNDPFYRDHQFHSNKHYLIGDAFGLDWLGVLLGGEATSIGNTTHHAALKLDSSEIENLDIIELMSSSTKIQAHVQELKSLREKGRKVWSWINVPGLIQCAWHLRGDALLMELEEQPEKAAISLEKSIEIIESSLKFDLEHQDNPDDQRILHTPMCYLATLMGEQSYELCLKYEKILQRTIRDLNQDFYRLHLCAKPSEKLCDYLDALNPIDEMEILASTEEIESLVTRYKGCRVGTLLESDFFKGDDAQEQWSDFGKNCEFACLYDTDEDTDLNKICDVIANI